MDSRSIPKFETLDILIVSITPVETLPHPMTEDIQKRDYKYSRTSLSCNKLSPLVNLL